VDSQSSSIQKLSIDRGARAALPRRPWWRRGWILVVALALAAAAAAVFASRGRPLEVEIGRVATAFPSQALTTLVATGHVVPQTRASVSSKGTGRLEWLGVQEGQAVKAHQVIARLENRDVAAQRDQAAASVEAAKANVAQGEAERQNAQIELDRTRDLASRNFVSSSALDSAQARYNKALAAIESLRAQVGVAQANLHAAEVNFDQTLIRAPFDGVVLTKNANVGDILTPFSSASGTTGAVVTMADMGTLEVEADVSESSIAKIAPGQPAEVQLDAFPDARLLGTVSRVVPDVDRAKATLLVKVHFDEPDARVLPDMSAKISFLSRRPTPQERVAVTALRAEAVTRRDGRDLVFVVRNPAAAEASASLDGGTVSAVHVTPGPRIGDLVQVGGLAAGTPIVISPPAKLAEGLAVVALKK